MSIFAYVALLVLALCFVFLSLLCRNCRKTNLPNNWPIVGMLPGVLVNMHRIHEYLTDVLIESGGTFVFKGPLFANMNMVFTCDSANVHHVLCKNFSNYPKGPEFNKIFNELGDGIFNTESELWEIQRKSSMSAMNHANFKHFLKRTIEGKVREDLIPIMDCATKSGLELDLAELFGKFTYDISCILVLGHNPRSISVDPTHAQSEKALKEYEEVVLHRHLLPEHYWKLQRWLQIGTEKKSHNAVKKLDYFLTHCIALKRQELRKGDHQEESFDLLTTFMESYKGVSGASGDSDKFLRDAILCLLFAATDTTSASLTWLFYLIAHNPHVETKIREEIKTNINSKQKYNGWRLFDELEDLNKLVYLHGALCESLRLYPPVPWQHKAPIQPDTLPSGHLINKNVKTLLSFYAMGRMEKLWGEDCLEFKPERWISDSGQIKHVPSYKFVTFNTGPRTCLGKEMSFITIKIVAATMIYHYNIQMVDGHLITQTDSMILHMRHGLKARVTKRSD